jgi:16S rRNA (guanine966-N2)-methyltransferase
VRIQAGWAKGTELAVPQGELTRPTSAKVRAAAINMLAPYMSDGTFLDLCAGSGAMGLEAVSRGASGAAFIELSTKALSCLKGNAAEVTRRARAQQLPIPRLLVIPGELPQAIGRLQRNPLAPFATVFIDPPYKQAVALAKAALAALHDLTMDGATFVVESAAGDGPELAKQESAIWSLLKQRAYGDTMLTIFTKNAGNPDGDADVASSV